MRHASPHRHYTINRTAREAGWNYSEYNLFARVPNQKKVAWLNTLSGSCSEFSLAEYVFTKQLLDLPEDDRMIAHYTKRGLITQADEKELLRQRLEQSSRDDTLLHLTILPTLACNFDCPYCFERHMPGFISPEVMEEIVRFTDRTLEKHPFKRLQVLWFGGEPLLAIEQIDELSKQLISLSKQHKTSYRAAIITNGYLLNDEAVKILKRAKVSNAQITLDGLAKSHDKTRCLVNGQGTFDTIVNNIISRRLPFHVQIRHNVTRENRPEIKALHSFVTRLAEESGNSISYYDISVSDNDAARERQSEVSVLCQRENAEYEIRNALEAFLDPSLSLFRPHADIS